MHSLKPEVNLEDLAAKALCLGRQVAERARALQLGENARDVAFVSRCFARLQERQPFHEMDEGGFAAVLEIIERSIASEYLGTEDRFETTGYDEFGPRGEICKTTVYTDRGIELLEFQGLFTDFLYCRNGVLDQVAAHRCLLNMMSS